MPEFVQQIVAIPSLDIREKDFVFERQAGVDPQKLRPPFPPHPFALVVRIQAPRNSRVYDDLAQAAVINKPRMGEKPVTVDS